MNVPSDWHLNNEHKEAKKLNEMITSLAKKLTKSVQEAESDEKKYEAVFTFYRKYITVF